MSLSNFFRGSWTEPRYIRRTRAYLQEARMAALEHSIAAEHYQSSAAMYADRAKRLEEEIRSWELQRSGAILPQDMGHDASSLGRLSSLAKLEPAMGGQSVASSAIGIARAA